MTDSPSLSRRRLFGLAGAGVAAAGVTGVALGRASADGSGQPTDRVAELAQAYPFYGEHQAGIITPAQDRLHFVAFDVTTDDRTELVQLLQQWTDAAARMTRGEPAGPYGAVSGPYDAPPDDTGEAIGLPPSGLTITFGFGPGLFADAHGRDRFGVKQQRPAALVDLPHFPGDTLEAARSGGDLCVQACAHDPQVAVHAVRNLARIGFGTTAVRWSQLGFGRTSSTSTAQATPRNLFGFKDGTANIKAEEAEALEEFVWAQAGDGEEWMAGGSYLVVRRIRMTIETWDRTSLREQEAITGRTKGEGAPLSGGTEFTEPDFSATGRGDLPLIPAGSHVRLAHPDSNAGVRILRRGYNFTDGSDGLGRLDAGLFFIAYQRDIAQFVRIQTALSRDDTMNEYIRHVGSATFAVPPGVEDSDGYIGQTLFG